MDRKLIDALRRFRSPRTEVLLIAGERIPVHFVRTRRARRYILRVRRDGAVRLTLPLFGSVAEAMVFIGKSTDWLRRQIELRKAEQSVRAAPWGDGTELQFRGQSVRLQVRVDDGVQVVQFAAETLIVKADTADLRVAVESHLWSLAAKELPPFVMRAAAQYGVQVSRVTVRNQRSRWGSCSPRGTISLNWRLIQAPPFVRDYLIVHELMHLREMNHSPRFWREVAMVCPWYSEAEAWLNAHAKLLSATG